LLAGTLHEPTNQIPIRRSMTFFQQRRKHNRKTETWHAHQTQPRDRLFNERKISFLSTWAINDWKRSIKMTRFRWSISSKRGLDI
jgi:hypothetical protein